MTFNVYAMLRKKTQPDNIPLISLFYHGRFVDDYFSANVCGKITLR